MASLSVETRCEPKTAMDRSLKLIASSEYINRLQKIVEAAFAYGREVLTTVENGLDVGDELRTRDELLRAKYTKVTSEFVDLYPHVREYMAVLDAHPPCHEERLQRISRELHDTDEKARLDPRNDSRFPNTIHFLKHLDNWLDSVARARMGIKTRIEKFDFRTRREWLRAREVECTVRRRKRVIAGTGLVGLLGTVGGVGVLLATGSLLGSVILPVAGTAALWSYLLLDTFKEKEESSHEFKTRLEKVKKRSRKIHKIIRQGPILPTNGKHSDPNRDKSTTSAAGNTSTNSSRYPLLTDVNKSVEKIFRVFERCYEKRCSKYAPRDQDIHVRVWIA